MGFREARLLHVLMLFLDGVGIGRRDSGVNPFFAARIPAFRFLFGGDPPTLRSRRRTGPVSSVVPLDATLGVPGLPQSGTGQTTLFTGYNGPKLAGKHFGPYPPSSLRPVVEERNIFRQIFQSGKRPYFANAYPQRFFDYAEKRPTRLSVTSYAYLKSGFRLLEESDLARGDGISGDITNAGWKELGYPEMEVITPAEAGRRLARLTAHHDFVLFEYWKTDHAGHSRSMDEAVSVLETLDALLGGVLETLDPATSLLLLTSDHGNVEDLSTKTHTRNPVPALLYGRRHAEAASALDRAKGTRASLMNVTPLVLTMLASDPE